jgi:hypothetical protein
MHEKVCVALPVICCVVSFYACASCLMYLSRYALEWSSVRAVLLHLIGSALNAFYLSWVLKYICQPLARAECWLA